MPFYIWISIGIVAGSVATAMVLNWLHSEKIQELENKFKNAADAFKKN